MKTPTYTDRALKEAALMVDCKVKIKLHKEGNYRFYTVVTKDGEFIAHTGHEVIGLLEVYAGGHPNIDAALESLGR